MSENKELAKMIFESRAKAEKTLEKVKAREKIIERYANGILEVFHTSNEAVVRRDSIILVKGVILSTDNREDVVQYTIIFGEFESGSVWTCEIFNQENYGNNSLVLAAARKLSKMSRYFIKDICEYFNQELSDYFCTEQLGDDRYCIRIKTTCETE